jgi:hypothetical protein
MKIKTNKPDSRWLKIARERGFTLKTGEPAWLPLKKILLDIGGWGVCTSRVEEDMELILSRGRKFPGKSKLMLGEPCQCHLNSACCWDENRELCKICTGYALSKDGMWRQHSWIFTNNGAVVETTEKRVAYFGYVMTHEQCEDFLADNFI